MNIPTLRLQRQHIEQPRLTKTEQVVAWLGGLQGQDYPGAKWSIALRMPSATETNVVQAFDTGKLVRTWPMRGTLHVVAAQDLRWMLMLTAPKNLTDSAGRRRALALNDTTLVRCREVFTPWPCKAANTSRARTCMPRWRRPTSPLKGLAAITSCGTAPCTA